MADKKAKGGEQTASGPPPLRSMLAALGVGLAWGAMHIPNDLGDRSTLVAWLVHALVAALIAKSVLDLGGSILIWTAKVSAQLLRRVVG
ncbi:MAG TPA: hypothetical protein VFA48_06340 [Gammaproteobacteria bacterium]|nr:hypothetical protein [Gammaproteobacteria bacterium]